MQVSVIILAAGQGTRMNSDLPKVLHQLAAAPLLHHALATAQSLEPSRIVTVTGHGGEAVAASAAAFVEMVETVVQDPQLGTGHAVAQAAPLLSDEPGEAIVLYADTPLIREGTLRAMLAARAKHAVVILGFHAKDPGRYGRLLTEGDELLAIREFKDATPEERKLTLCNSGVVCAEARTLFSLIAEIKNDNAAGEYYLTDIVELARKRGLSAGVVLCPEAETLGVNTRAQLAEAEAAFQTRARRTHMDAGVTLSDPSTVYFAADTQIGPGTTIGQNVVFGPGVRIAAGVTVKPFCHLEGVTIETGAIIGPFARLRPGSEIGPNAHIGNFVETKAAKIGPGAKANHLTYLGDATVGAGANIGAGTITCNYDGFFKYQTVIGEGAFIGSNASLVAPVTIGANANTAAGSVITRDVPADALAIERSPQAEKPGWAARFRAMMKARKEKKD